MGWWKLLHGRWVVVRGQDPQISREPAYFPSDDHIYKASRPWLLFPTVDLPHYNRSNMALLESLGKANLVPGAAASLIPSDFKATAELGVTFGPQAINLGNLVRNSQVTKAPQIKISSDVCCGQARS